ncbi:unnamed protein product [Diatraea saccharalis]|uniref:Uncharacterized protein n=1 Tax=Diatraea saccharalis TaxID=40085 RepID=A0A9N9R478_9NEOP|nr:unnamed protein product [Diatraea saccharalis]
MCALAPVKELAVVCVRGWREAWGHRLVDIVDEIKNRFEDILMMEIPPWIINPFDETEVADVVLQEELLELSTNEELKVQFKKGYQRFWLQAKILEKYRDK